MSAVCRSLFSPSTSSTAITIITACAALRGEVLILVFYLQHEVYTQIKAKLLVFQELWQSRAYMLPFSPPFTIYTYICMYIWFYFGLPTHDDHRPLPLSCLSFPAYIPFQVQFTCLPFPLASFPAFPDAGSWTQNFTHAQQTLPLSWSINPVSWTNDERTNLLSISFHIPRSPGGFLTPTLFVCLKI